MKRLSIVLFFTFGIFSLYFKVSPFMDDFKVRTSPYASYFTLRNNPLFPRFDPDAYQLVHHTRVDSQAILPRGMLSFAPIDDPQFDTAESSPFKDADTIIGVYHNGIAKAYPYLILSWHEVVNDRFGSDSVSVTLCPFCDTNPVFLTKERLAATGKVFQSGIVISDRTTHTLWSQPLGLAIAGHHVNQTLKRIPGHKTTLGQWKKAHPDTVVLSTSTGHRCDYKRNPYRKYAQDQSIIFPVRNLDKCSASPKAIVSYIWNPDDGNKFNHFSGSSYMVYHDVMKQIKEKTFIFERVVIKAKWDDSLGTVRFFNKQSGEEIPSSTAYAFAYFALLQ